MPANNSIRVAEFEKLYYDEEKPFKQQHWEALCRYSEGLYKSSAKQISFFRIINKGIQFTNYVGVIQAGNLTIEVLPKTDKSFATAANERIDMANDTNKQQWHHALLQMLAECRLINIHAAYTANLSLQKHSILDIYLQLFLDEAERLLHTGLLKKYQQQQGNQPALKGQLLFHKQLAHNSLHQERFYVRNAMYDANNLYNRILYKALQLVYNISSYAIKDKAGRLLLSFPELSNVNVTAETFSQLTYNRKTEDYRTAMQMAGMLLLNYYPDITGGAQHIAAILFDMNQLWEEWVYRRLKIEETAFCITVQRQQSTNFWEAVYLAKPKTIRPDIVIKKADQTIILDTKWKLIEDNTPGDEDLKQLFVYNLYWHCTESVLLYPANEAIKTVAGQYKEFTGMNRAVCTCLIITQSVFNEEGKLNSLFGKIILGKILDKQSVAETEN